MKALFHYYSFLKEKALHSNIFLLLLFSFLILLHIPFLEADPHIIVSYGRDAFTDEGLYSSQVRNYIHFGRLNMQESDALIKTPLFSTWLFIWYKIFGVSLWVSRISIIFFAISILFLVAQTAVFARLLSIFISLFAFTTAPFFNYAHYSMAEVPAIMCIYAAIIFLACAVLNSSMKYLLLSCLFFVITWLFKIQFIYVLLIPILFFLALFIFLIATKKTDAAMKYFKMFLIMMVIFILALLLFYILWILPNEKLFRFVMNEQTQARLVKKHELYDYVTSMYSYYFNSVHLKYLVKSFYAFCFTGLLLLWIRPSKEFIIILCLFIIWILIETHKLFMYYMPMRYLVPLFFCGFAIIALIFTENMIQASKPNLYIRLLLVFNMVFSAFYFYNNYQNYSNFYTSRKYNIADACKYFSNYNFSNRPLMGTWVPSLTWNNKAYILPIWDNYFNNENILEKFNPKIVITEDEEQDSNHAISKKNMDIWSKNDSVIYRNVGDWYLKIVWLN